MSKTFAQADVRLYSFMMKSLCLLMVFNAACTLHAADAKPSAASAGLAVRYSSAGQTDLATAPNVALFVEAGKLVTPFLAPGNFTAVWEGALSADLRSDYAFQATLNGSLKLEINGAVALDVSGTGGSSPVSKPVTLNKGANVLKATFTAPGQGDAFVRLGWTEKGTSTGPISESLFTHTPSADGAKAAARYLGRELFFEARCVKCHLDPAKGTVELTLDAPSLEGIGARRHYEWMTRWILDPKSVRPAAHMPKMLHGPKAKEDAEAMAAYLASLKTEPPVKFPAILLTKQNKPEDVEGHAPAGDVKPIYERLHCIGCHNPPDAKEMDPKKLSQKGVGTKFPRGKLAEYLRAPEAHYAWNRMPNFRLTAAEAKELEDYLLSTSDKPKDVAAPTEAAVIERGKKLVQTTGCLNCHSLKLENQFTAPKLADLDRTKLEEAAKKRLADFYFERWWGGCLQSAPTEKTPDFGFTENERKALREFGESEAKFGFPSLTRHVPMEHASRQARLLNCSACHGQVELIPPTELLGGKLKPEWAAKFIAGDINHKMRYDAHPKGELWVEARMPAFRAHAATLAPGLAALHGYPAKTPADKSSDPELVKAGHKLIGKDGGMSCISCHAVGKNLALEVFESEGVNLAYTYDRLLPDYYRRWFRNPLSIDPQTKMPAYFGEDGNTSPFPDLLGGSVDTLMQAVWEYMRLGDQMPAPKTGAE